MSTRVIGAFRGQKPSQHDQVDGLPEGRSVGIGSRFIQQQSELMLGAEHCCVLSGTQEEVQA